MKNRLTILLVIAGWLATSCTQERVGEYEMTWEVSPTIHTDFAPADDVELTFSDDPCTTYHIVSRDLGPMLTASGSKTVRVTWQVTTLGRLDARPQHPLQIGSLTEWDQKWSSWSTCRDHDPSLPVPK